ncbi:phage tail tube protein [Alicyclobacillus sendaiensis]|uniref:phage tail tube protein n=1 Tax=Alicyclobacillus sendaiensis TaxID=192387 RepID=UPI0026F474CE|nr:phage tail tube protein [Alicyclobacillus sendaiensis]
MPAKLTSLSYLGLGVETTLGTPVAPTGFVPVRSFKPQDNPKFVADTGYRGQPVDLFGEYLGVISAEYGVDGYAYPSSFGNFLGAIFGQDTVTGTAAPYTHTFVPQATVPSYTISDYYVAGFRQWAGAKCDKLSIKFTPDAGLSYSAHFIGFPSVTGTAPSSQTFGVNPYFLGWEASLSLNGSADATLRSVSIDLERKGSNALFSAQNSQKPWDIFVGPFGATWELEFYMTADTEYVLALTQGTVPVVLTITQPGTNAQLVFQSSAVQFTKPTIDRGDEYVSVSLSGSAIYNATDGSVMVAKLINSVSTAYTTTAAS